MTTLIPWELEAPPSATGDATDCRPSRFDGPDPIIGPMPAIFEQWNRAGGARAGEVKPHSRAGIAAGVRQLAGRTGTRGPVKAALLVTYRRPPGEDNRAEILGAEVDVAALQTWAAANRKRGRGQPPSPTAVPLPVPTTWYHLAFVPFSWTAPITLAQCPTCVGNRMETLARQVLDKRRGGQFNLSAKNRRKRSSAGGADLYEVDQLRGEVGYLRELVRELTEDRGRTRW